MDERFAVLLSGTASIVAHANGLRSNMAPVNARPAPDIVLAWDGGGSGGRSGALSGQRTAAHPRQWNGQWGHRTGGQTASMARGVPMAGRGSRLIGSGSLAAQSLINPSQIGAARQAGGVIPSWLGNTHGCCHGEAEANDETTNQIIPQSPRERTSVTVHAVLSGRRAVFVRREPRGVLRFSIARAAGIWNRVRSHPCTPPGAQVDRLQVTERAYRAPALQREGLAFPIWSYLSCYPARYMASPRIPGFRTLPQSDRGCRINFKGHPALRSCQRRPCRKRGGLARPAAQGFRAA